MKPLEAALKGAGEIGFTIISISISLVAVFIPLLLMGGIIGRLFREFAVTLTMAIVVSAFVVADADADDGVALPAQRDSETEHGRLYQITERGFDAHAAAATSAASMSCCAISSRTLLRVPRDARRLRSICSSSSPRASSRSRTPA